MIEIKLFKEKAYTGGLNKVYSNNLPFIINQLQLFFLQYS